MKPKLGDYALASKYSNGSCGDPFALGIVSEIHYRSTETRYVLVNQDNDVIYSRNGFRYAKKISQEEKNILLQTLTIHDNDPNVFVWEVLKKIRKKEQP